MRSGSCRTSKKSGPATSNSVCSPVRMPESNNLESGNRKAGGGSHPPPVFRNGHCRNGSTVKFRISKVRPGCRQAKQVTESPRHSFGT